MQVEQHGVAALRRRLGDRPFLGAGAAEDVAHGVVALVALVRQHLVIGLRRDRERDRERRRVSLRIRDGDRIIDLVIRDAREALDERPCDDRRNLARLDRASGAGLSRRLYCRAHSPLLGRISGAANGRSDHHYLRQASQGISGQAHRHCRVRLAERRIQHAQSQSRTYRTGGRAARFCEARRSVRDGLQRR